MTEQEWLQATDPQPMLEFLWDKASDRKFRLFAVACCRRIRSFLSDERSCKAIEVSERYADGQASDQELLQAEDGAGTAAEVIEDVFRKGGGDAMIVNAAVAVCQGIATSEARNRVMPDVWWGLLKGGDALPASRAAAKFSAFAVAGTDRNFTQVKYNAERKIQAILARCVFGHLYYPVSLDSAWLAWNDGTIAKLAQAIYDERAFDRMPILADALEEAGCTNQDILAHCRSGGEHVRGCWVVDLVLGKE